MQSEINERMVCAHPDLEGICRSPHDNPPGWAMMLTMYLDESMQPEDGYVVVAGFVGNDDAWNECMKQWSPALGKRKGLHMKSIRGWDRDSTRKLLRTLGSIPAQCGLTLVYCAVKVSDYSDLVEGSMADLFSEGYLISMFMLICMAMLELPVTDRLEIICEEQKEHAAIRSALFKIGNKMEEWKTPEGLPRLAKWSSIAKRKILEPSDYAAYSLLQQLIDMKSKKAQMCAPILINSSKIGRCIGRAEVRFGVSGFKGRNHEMSPSQKRFLRAAFKEVYKAEI